MWKSENILKEFVKPFGKLLTYAKNSITTLTPKYSRKSKYKVSRKEIENNLRTYLGLSCNVTNDFNTPGPILSARTPCSDMKSDFSFT